MSTSSPSPQPYEPPLVGLGGPVAISDEGTRSHDEIQLTPEYQAELLTPPISVGLEPLLIAAVKRNDLAKFEDYLNVGQSAWIIAEHDDRGKNALHWAAELSRVEMVLMLAPWQDLEAKDDTGRTALFYAIEAEESIALVEILLAYGAQVNHVDNNGKSPLRLALEGKNDGLVARLAEHDTITWPSLALKYGRNLNGNYPDRKQMARLLIQRGADALATNENGRTAIHIAAAVGNIAALRLLQPFQYTVERRDGDGETALSLAAIGGWRHVVKYLLEEWGADINTQDGRGWTPLHHAASKGHPQVVAYLLDQGADQFARTRSGYTPLWIACLSREDEIGLKLLEEMTIPRAFSLQSPDGMSLAWVAAARNCIKVMTSLIRHAKRDTEDDILSGKFQGCSYAFVAIRAGCHDTAIALLEAGATIEGFDKDGNNALHHAALRNNAILVSWLLKHDNQAGQWSKMRNSNRQTPEEAAASLLNKDALTVFLRHCDPERAESANAAGWTALHWAAFYGRLDLASILVMARADVTIKDRSGKTAIEVVQSSQQATMERSMFEWLSLPDSQQTTNRPDPLSRPSFKEDDEGVCKGVSALLVDFYNSTTIEKSWVSVHDVLYNFGAQDIMSIAARAHGIAVEDELRMRWIHLPVNNTFWLKDLLQSIYVDLAKSWDDRRGDIASSTSNAAYFSYRSTPEAPLDLRLDQNDDAGKTRVRFDDEYISVPSEDDSDSDDSIADTAGLTQASAEHSKLLSFIDSCIPLEPGAGQFQHVAPFIKFLTTGSSGKYYSSDITNLESIRVGLSIPYFAFTRVRNQSGYRKPMFHVNGDPGERLKTRVPGAPRRRESQAAVVDIYRESVHVPQTLDEFYYQFLADVDNRTTDQVIYRHQGLPPRSIEEQERFVCVVDQLWLYVVDDGTIITSCSQHLHEDAINLQATIKKHITDMKDKNVGPASIYSITPLILAVCVRTTMEWEFGETNDKGSLLDVFAESIARTADRQVVLYDEFKKTLTTEESIQGGGKQSVREIREEIGLLQEVNDILDELNIIKSVLLSQESIMEECINFLRLAVSAESFENIGPPEIDEGRKSLLQTYYYCRALSRIDRFQEQVEKMTQDAKDVQHNLNNLLDLRQKDANLAEAIWARKASEESTRQSRTITVFTVVTIIFLPITFLSSLFALDITSFPHSDGGDLQYSPSWAFSWLIGMTVAVSVPLIMLAFFVNEVYDLWTRLSYAMFRGKQV